MNELIDFKRMWNWCVERWRTSFATIMVSILAFGFGSAYERKTITEDCKFAKVFRDGTQVYDCQLRLR